MQVQKFVACLDRLELKHKKLKGSSEAKSLKLLEPKETDFSWEFFETELSAGIRLVSKSRLCSVLMYSCFRRQV